MIWVNKNTHAYIYMPAYTRTATHKHAYAHIRYFDRALNAHYIICNCVSVCTLFIQYTICNIQTYNTQARPIGLGVWTLLHIHKNTHIRTHTHTYTYRPTYTMTHIHMHIYKHIHTNPYIHILAYTPIYTHTYTPIYTHTQLHTYTYIGGSGNLARDHIVWRIQAFG